MCPGMMPAFAMPAEMMPGQLGPMSRIFLSAMNSKAFIMSMVGMPSVMQTTRPMPASAASITASAANAGGTKISEALAPTFSTASATVSNTGQPSWIVPPLPGVTPPDHVGAVGGALLRVERALSSGESLDDQSRVVVDENGHYGTSSPAAYSRRPSGTASRALECRRARRNRSAANVAFV